MSRPTVSKAKTSYPIYAATWANSRPSYLVVAGGGGAGNHGIKNMITLFDFSSRAPNVESCAELDVSQDDSVTCLANLATKNGLILYAGNGSSEEDKAQGKDLHFRSFDVQFGKSKPADSSEEKPCQILPLSKTMLFRSAKSETARKEVYQRLVRLSPAQRTTSSTPNKRIGAIASALAGEENEVVIFSATSNRPQPQDIIQRVSLGGREANDLDIIDQGEGRFQVAYVLDQDVYVHNIHYDFDLGKSRAGSDGVKVYTVPHPDIGESKARPALRGVRWLTSKHLLLLANQPNRSGVELKVLHAYQDGTWSIVSRKTLKSHVTAATDMDVAILDSDSSGAYQVAVAIAGADFSLSVGTMDYFGPDRDSLSQFHLLATYHQVHGHSMTKTVWSPFYKPDSATGKTFVPYLRLASTSLANTVSVETFELQPSGSRHVLQTRQSRVLQSAATYSVIAIIGLALALLIQSVLDPEGRLTQGLVPKSLQNAAVKTFGEAHRDQRHAAVLNNANSPAIKVERRIRDILHLHNPPSGSGLPQSEKALIIHHDPDTDGALSTEVHDDHEAVLKKHDAAKKWDDLSAEDQLAWKTKLTDAGMWAVDEGETILKSIFFGQIGGLVGQVAQGVLG